MVHHDGDIVSHLRLRLPSLGNGIGHVLGWAVKSEKPRRQLPVQMKGSPIARSSPERILIEEVNPVDESRTSRSRASAKERRRWPKVVAMARW